MTSEVLILNKRAVVLGADSAVTTSGGEHPRYSKSANKIFEVSRNGSVAAAIYGSANIDLVPWELALKLFRSHLGATTFGSVSDDIGELLCAMEGFKGTFVVSCALRLAPYLFCRPGELRTAEWAHFHNLDGECPEYHIPPANRKLLRAKKEAKDAEPHIIPLPRQAVAILNELRALIHGVELRFIHNWHW